MTMYIEIQITYMFEKGCKWKMCPSCRQVAQDMANKCIVVNKFWLEKLNNFLK